MAENDMVDGQAVQQVVTGVVFDAFVVLPLPAAVRDAAIMDALAVSETWGELRAALGPIAPAFLSDLSDPEEPPADEDELPPDLMDPECWPPPAMGITYDCLPRDLAERFGEVEVNPSGWWLRIHPGHAAEITAELEARGWTVTSNQSLVGQFQLD